MPRTGNSMQDPSLLMAALEGLQLQKQRIEEQIQEVRSLLGKKAPGKPGRPASSTKGPIASTIGKRGRLSPAARKRIAAAQKRRWAEYRKSATSKSA